MAEDLEKRLAEIESMLSKVKFWGAVLVAVGAVFGYSLKETWASVKEANANASNAKTIAEDTLGKLTDARTQALGEVDRRGQEMLEGYRNQFASWVKESQAPFVPDEMVAAWLGTGNPPRGWRVCDGTAGTPNLDTAILLGTLDPSTVGFVKDSGENPTRISETNRLVGRPVTNATAGFFRVRFICRR